MASDTGDYAHSATHPFNNPAMAVEMTMREREALMTQEDWALNVDRFLATPVGTPSAADIQKAADIGGDPK